MPEPAAACSGACPGHTQLADRLGIADQTVGAELRRRRQRSGIVRVAGVGPNVVVEVGRGLGSLTLATFRGAGHRPEGRPRPGCRHRRTPSVTRAPDLERLLIVHARPAGQTLPVRLRRRWSPTSPTTSRCHRPALIGSLTIRRVLVMVSSVKPSGLAAQTGSKVTGVPSAKAAWYADYCGSPAPFPLDLLAGPRSTPTPVWCAFQNHSTRDDGRPGRRLLAIAPSPNGARPYDPPWPTWAGSPAGRAGMPRGRIDPTCAVNASTSISSRPSPKHGAGEPRWSQPPPARGGSGARSD